MDEHDWMAERFEEHRTHLRAVAYRMLGSLAEADDAAGLVWAQRGEPRVVFGFTISGGKIVAIDLLADPERIRQLDLAVLS